jgi:hypothetical protein
VRFFLTQETKDWWMAETKVVFREQSPPPISPSEAVLFDGIREILG